LPKRIVDAREKTPFLLFLPHLQPEFDQNDPRVGYVFFDFRAKAEEPLHLLRAGKSHHVFNARPVVPAPIEYDDFAGCREMLDVPL
jgi:hypothetical protein